MTAGANETTALAIYNEIEPWSPPSNRDHTMAQGGETPSHRKEWDMTAWNWDSVAFFAQSASGMATDMASGGHKFLKIPLSNKSCFPLQGSMKPCKIGSWNLKEPQF
jgi:hypothetical protein